MSKEENWSDKEYVLERVKNDGMALQYASEGLRDDRDVVMKAIENNGTALEYASEELRADMDVVLCAIENDVDSVSFVSEDMWSSKSFVKEAVKIWSGCLYYASEELRADKDIILWALKNNQDDEFSALTYASPEFFDEETLAYLNSYYEKFTIEELYENRYYGDFGFHYTFMGEYMWGVSKDLWSIRSFVKEAVKITFNALNCAPKEFLQDKEIVMLALKTYSAEVENADYFEDFEDLGFDIIKNYSDKDIAMALLSLDGSLFEYASRDFRSDKDLINAAVKNYPEAFRYKCALKGTTKKGIYSSIDSAFERFKCLNPDLQLICDENTMENWYDFMTWFYVNDDVYKHEEDWGSLGDSDIELVISPLIQCAMNSCASEWSKSWQQIHYANAKNEFNDVCFSCSAYEDDCEDCDGEKLIYEESDVNFDRILIEIRDSIDTSSFKELIKIKI